MVKKELNFKLSEKKEWLSELELTRDAANFNEHARHELVKRLMHRVRRLSASMAGHTWEPEDLAQTALIEILHSAGNFRGDSSLNRWADRITILTALKRIKQNKRREQLFVLRNDFGKTPVTPDEAYDTNRVQRRIAKLVGTLSVERRTVIALHYIQGYKLHEIAEMTNTLPNTVKDRIRVGRKKLKKKILADPILKEWVKTRLL
jgi:RNA polymerase sigma-70 factor (ECF subfamily)